MSYELGLLEIVAKRSCPAVSHICNLIFTPATVIILNSTKSFAKVLEIAGLDQAGHSYTISPIPLDNLKHILHLILHFLSSND